METPAPAALIGAVEYVTSAVPASLLEFYSESEKERIQTIINTYPLAVQGLADLLQLVHDKLQQAASKHSVTAALAGTHVKPPVSPSRPALTATSTAPAPSSSAPRASSASTTQTKLFAPVAAASTVAAEGTDARLASVVGVGLFSPARKKTDAVLTRTQLQFPGAGEGGATAVYPKDTWKHLLLLQTPDKPSDKPWWSVILLTHSGADAGFTVQDGDVNIETPSSSPLASLSGRRLGLEGLRALLLAAATGAEGTTTPLSVHNPDVFTSAKSRGYVPAYHKSKDGSLYFMRECVFFGMKKPLLLLTHNQVFSVYFQAVTGRTFDLNIVFYKGVCVPGLKTESVEFTMIDISEYAPIAAYIRKVGLPTQRSMSERESAKAPDVLTPTAQTTTTTSTASSEGQIGDRTRIPRAAKDRAELKRKVEEAQMQTSDPTEHKRARSHGSEGEEEEESEGEEEDSEESSEDEGFEPPEEDEIPEEFDEAFGKEAEGWEERAGLLKVEPGAEEEDEEEEEVGEDEEDE